MEIIFPNRAIMHGTLGRKRHTAQRRVKAARHS